MARRPSYQLFSCALCRHAFFSTSESSQIYAPHDDCPERFMQLAPDRVQSTFVLGGWQAVKAMGYK